MASVDEGFLLVAEPPQEVNLSLQKELLLLHLKPALEIPSRQILVVH
jgi:hypothetical protein